MKLSSILYLVTVIVAVLVVSLSYLLFLTPQLINCEQGEEECIEKVDDFRDDCIPSESIITVGNETNYIKMKITIYKEGDKCFTKEEVLEDHNSNFSPIDLTGYNNTCNMTAEELEKYGPHACQGSLADFIIPIGKGDGGSGGGNDGFGDGTPSSSPPHIYCPTGDWQCTEDAVVYVNNCDPAEIEASEFLSYGPQGASFITSYLEVSRTVSDCVFYYRILNIVNLPPEIPPEVIGMDMVCSAPLTEFPRSGIEREWCQGELIDYFDILHYV